MMKEEFEERVGVKVTNKLAGDILINNRPVEEEVSERDTVSGEMESHRGVGVRGFNALGLWDSNHRRWHDYIP